ncbi:MAG: alpha/beta hydrolase [Candidatus Omnitrophota bacterium]
MNRSIKKEALRTGRFLLPLRIYENQGPELVCLNGVQQSMAMWSSFIRRFRNKYRIVLFDFPNQGRGRILSGPVNASLEEQIEILHAVLKSAKVGNNLTICAASWGGVVGAAFAAKYPDKVKRLILASLGTRPNKKMIETIQRGSNISSENRREMAETLIESFGQNLPGSIKQKIIAQFNNMSSEKLKAFHQHGLFVLGTKEIGDVVKLRDIRAETILINGEKDSIIDLNDVKFLATQIPDCQLRIVKNAGHFLHLERQEILDLYQEILEKHVKDNT